MPGSKEIRTKIKSVQNTRKITKAMEMVAASKMRKAQERMRAARPYSEKIRRLAANLSQANVTEYRHAFLMPRQDGAGEARRPDRRDLGQGPLRRPQHQHPASVPVHHERVGAQGKDIRVTCIGNKGLGFMQRWCRIVISHVIAPGRHAAPGQAHRAGQGQLDAFIKGEIDACTSATPVHQHHEAGAGTRAVAAAVRRTHVGTGEHSWDYLYEPDAKAVIDDLLVRYVEALIYQAVAENMASEQSHAWWR
jgi:F-type H+-transporting ATPase subunit gamma